MEAMVFLLWLPHLAPTVRLYSGYHRILFTEGKERVPAAELKDCFDEIITVKNIYDACEVERAFASVAARRHIAAVYGSYEAVQEMAAFLRDRFGVPGMNGKDTAVLRNKALMKETVRTAGIKTADFFPLRTLHEKLSWIAQRNFPAVVKPIDGYATRHTHKIEGLSNLLRPKVIRALLRRKECLAETFVHGDEFHCDSVVSGGDVVFAAVSRYLHNCLDTLDFRKPSGSIVLPDTEEHADVLGKIRNMNAAAVHALNIRDAVCHMEAFITQAGEPVFSEITARIGGSPHMGEAIINTYGVDLHEAFIRVGVGGYRPAVRPRPVCTGWVSFPSRRGTIREISVPESYYSLDGFVNIRIYNKPGDKIEDRHNTSIRTGYIVLEDDANDRLAAKLTQACDRFLLVVS